MGETPELEKHDGSKKEKGNGEKDENEKMEKLEDGEDET